jgi:hypothetical protein
VPMPFASVMHRIKLAGIVRSLGERSGADRPRLAPLEQPVGIQIAGNVGWLPRRLEYADRSGDVRQVQTACVSWRS